MDTIVQNIYSAMTVCLYNKLLSTQSLLSEH